MPCCVDHALAIDHDPDMIGKEDQIVAGKRCSCRKLGAERFLLHVAVARRGLAGGGKAALDEARTVDPGATPAAEDIGHAKKAFGCGCNVARRVFVVGGLRLVELIGTDIADIMV